MLGGESIDSDNVEIELSLEVVMNYLLDCAYTFDGITGLTSKKRKPRQIVFEGKIWVIKNCTKWDEMLEPFRAVVTDKRITKQGFHIKIWFGEEIKEGNLLEIFN
ncbi:MAG TPA: hypothetical protein PKY59_07355 [Pyrinomonadaceae bacterium]|nr:hypothetical protein [Pyrinomonadaceae bacterium]